MEEEQLFCARCQRRVWLAWHRPEGHKRRWRGSFVAATKHWPEGYICSGCFAAACEVYGRCPGCDIDRLLPGRTDTGDRVCADCADLPASFRCQRCGQEGWLAKAATCGRCVLTERLDQVLDDGTGRVRPELVPLRERLRAMPRPRSGLVWLNKPHVPPILQALARGTVPLTHDGLSTLTPWRSVIYVRDLLVSTAVLPNVDRFQLLFEQWLPEWLDSIAHDGHRQTLRRFATWHVLRHLRATAESRPVGPYLNVTGRAHLRQAAAFLAALAERGLTLAELTQDELDRWHASASATEKNMLRPFLLWAIRERSIHGLRLPSPRRAAPARVDQRQRLALIRRVQEDHDIELVDRLIALLILLYAQPAWRIVSLTVADVQIDDGQVLLRLGDPPVPVPPPFDQVLGDYLVSRPNTTTATNPASQWLFPGRRADQHLHPGSLRLRMRMLGVPVLNGRTAAIRHLLQEAPAAVVARMLGYSDGRAEVISTTAGARWQRYAATRARPGQRSSDC